MRDFDYSGYIADHENKIKKLLKIVQELEMKVKQLEEKIEGVADVKDFFEEPSN